MVKWLLLFFKIKKSPSYQGSPVLDTTIDPLYAWRSQQTSPEQRDKMNKEKEKLLLELRKELLKCH